MCFIAESKWNKDWKGLTEEEQVKINCAKVHFKMLEEKFEFKYLTFNWLNSVEDFKNKAGI